MKYMRDGITDEYGIAKLQDKILEVMVYIDEFCNEHNIDYCLMAGSALGARRHNGFIPWDDDIDIYMTEKDYNKFRITFSDCGDKNKYYLQEWGTFDKKGSHYITYAKLRMNHTLIEESTYVNWKIHKGIFVDIFIIHNCPESAYLQKKQYIWGEAIILKGLSVRKYKAKSFKERLLLSVGKMMPLKWIKYHGLKNNYKYGDDTKYLSGFMDTRDIKRAIFPRNIIFPTKYVDFEKVKLKVPFDNDAYLKIQFGEDYMALPPENKRQIGKHAINWKVETEQVYNDKSDEIKLI